MHDAIEFIISIDGHDLEIDIPRGVIDDYKNYYGGIGNLYDALMEEYVNKMIDSFKLQRQTYIICIARYGSDTMDFYHRSKYEIVDSMSYTFCVSVVKSRISTFIFELLRDLTK